MRFTIRFDGDISLDINEVWPDGAGPDNPTAKDVAKLLSADGSKHYALSDWGLDHALRVYVSADRGDEVEVWAHD